MLGEIINFVSLYHTVRLSIKVKKNSQEILSLVNI